ncbi:MAG: hypothetical protein FWE35_11605 [Streptosporangiales bacterium]|nr:hypothetical protein [Streptosporangiales bacterium]
MTLAGVTLDWEWEEAELDLLDGPPPSPPPVRRRWATLLALGAALAVVGAATAWNLQGYPGRVNNDEGTYMARAWAMLYEHHLSNYTYFWDHPFGGWAAIAGWMRLTDGLAWTSRALMVGRDFMWVVTMITSVLVFVLARRLGMSRVASAAAVALFGLSPLAVFYHRLVFLDNLSTMWVVAALAAAATWRRSLAAVVWSAAFFAAATWSKETSALLLPALVWLLVRYTPRRNRVKYLMIFAVIYGGLVGMWPLLAVVKGELLPGPGHVSMLGESFYQLAVRPGTGTILHYRSATWVQASLWFHLDRWLPEAGMAAALPALVIRRYRPIAAAIGIQVLYLVKGGYVPYAFVTVMIPIWALLISGVADTVWGPGEPASAGSGLGQVGRGWALAWRWTRRIPVIALAAGFALVVAPQWWGSMRAQASSNGFGTQDQAVAWVKQHVPAGDIVVCDDYPWVDIKIRTRAVPVSLWQVNSDPSVSRMLPQGYKNISYMILDPSSPLMFAALPGRPTLNDAIRHSTVIKHFGTIRIYKVRVPRPSQLPSSSRGRPAGRAPASPGRDPSDSRTGPAGHLPGQPAF